LCIVYFSFSQKFVFWTVRCSKSLYCALFIVRFHTCVYWEQFAVARVFIVHCSLSHECILCIVRCNESVLCKLNLDTSEFESLLSAWFPQNGSPPSAFLVDTSEEALLLPDWLKLRMIRSSVSRLVDAGQWNEHSLYEYN